MCYLPAIKSYNPRVKHRTLPRKSEVQRNPTEPNRYPTLSQICPRPLTYGEKEAQWLNACCFRVLKVAIFTFVLSFSFDFAINLPFMDQKNFVSPATVALHVQKTISMSLSCPLRFHSQNCIEWRLYEARRCCSLDWVVESASRAHVLIVHEMARNNVHVESTSPSPRFSRVTELKNESRKLLDFACIRPKSGGPSMHSFLNY